MGLFSVDSRVAFLYSNSVRLKSGRISPSTAWLTHFIKQTLTLPYEQAQPYTTGYCTTDTTNSNPKGFLILVSILLPFPLPLPPLLPFPSLSTHPLTKLPYKYFLSHVTPPHGKRCGYLLPPRPKMEIGPPIPTQNRYPRLRLDQMESPPLSLSSLASSSTAKASSPPPSPSEDDEGSLLFRLLL